MDSRLKNLREMLDYTQAELADMLGVSRQSLISLERGKCKPSIDLAHEIAEFFDMPIELIFPRIENIKNNQGGNMTNKEKRELMPWSSFSPFQELSRMHDEIDRMFQDSFFQDRALHSIIPAVNVVNKKDKILVEADLPGVDERDIDIEVSENYVKISGEKKESREVKKDDYYQRESSCGSFSRAVSLPEKVKSDKAEALMEKGKLTIQLPKMKIKGVKVKKIKPRKK